MNQNDLKFEAAKAALGYIEEDSIVGVGTGSTVNYFIDLLATIKHKIDAAVASSAITANKLKQHGIPVIDLNSARNIQTYVDGADEVSPQLKLIKGGGGALTGEKIIAAVAKQFVCIVDDSKRQDILGKNFPLPVEVIPMARSYVAREIVKLGGDPVYRHDFVTDHGNVILDVHNLHILNPIEMENTLNQITGVVTNGLFAHRGADVLLSATASGIQTLKAETHQ